MYWSTKSSNAFSTYTPKISSTGMSNLKTSSSMQIIVYSKYAILGLLGLCQRKNMTLQIMSPLDGIEALNC
jgi:hypothetical protein